MSGPTTNMPNDDAGRAIPVLGPDDSTTVTSTVTGTAQTVVLPEGDVYEMSVNVDIHLKVGTSDVTAATTSSRYLPAGSYVYRKLPTQTHVSVLRVDTTGIITFTRLR